MKISKQNRSVTRKKSTKRLVDVISQGKRLPQFCYSCKKEGKQTPADGFIIIASKTTRQIEPVVTIGICRNHKQSAGTRIHWYKK